MSADRALTMSADRQRSTRKIREARANANALTSALTNTLTPDPSALRRQRSIVSAQSSALNRYREDAPR